MTIAATAKAEVSGNSGETYTFEKVGTSPLNINTNTGEITIPASVNPSGNGQDLIITVRFIGDAARSVPTTEILTVRYVGVSPIVSANDSLQSRPQCHPGNQINGTDSLEIVMAAGEEGSEWNGGGNCSYLAFSDNIRVGNAAAPNLPIVRTKKTADGLELRDRQSNNEHVVGVTGNTFTYTADRHTLSIVIAYNDEGAGSHITDEYLRTVYIVFPGVPKLNAVLQDASGADAEVDKPLTVIVGSAGAKVVASVKASGGEDGGTYSYTGRAIECTGGFGGECGRQDSHTDIF